MSSDVLGAGGAPPGGVWVAVGVVARRLHQRLPLIEEQELEGRRKHWRLNSSSVTFQ